MSNYDNGFARAQADYESRMPPEPVEHEFTADVSVTFYLHIEGLTFDYGAQDEQMKDWTRDELMPRLANAIRKEIEPSGRDAARLVQSISYGYTTVPDPVVDSDYEITEIHE